jgi:hypothetical protein
LAVPLFAVPAAVYACSCAPLNAEPLARDEVAVVATLKRVDVLPVPEPTSGEAVPSSRPADFRFEVRAVLKGKKRIRRDHLVVRSGVGEGDCGLPQQVEKRYGLILERGDRRWLGSSCTTTTPRRLRHLIDGTNRRAMPMCRK